MASETTTKKTKRTVRKGAKRKRTWQLTKNTILYKQCIKYDKLIREGKMLCIDPSCGSTGSMPGWARYEAGVLIDSGIIEIPGITRDLQYRLQDLLEVLRTQFERPDILVTELIAPRRFGGGGATGHASLLRATGVVYAAWHDLPVLPVRPQAWRAFKHSSWIKSDEEDAIAFGHAVVDICGRINRGEVE